MRWVRPCRSARQLQSEVRIAPSRRAAGLAVLEDRPDDLQLQALVLVDQRAQGDQHIGQEHRIAGGEAESVGQLIGSPGCCEQQPDLLLVVLLVGAAKETKNRFRAGAPVSSQDLAQFLSEHDPIVISSLEPIEHVADRAVSIGQVGEQRGVRL